MGFQTYRPAYDWSAKDFYTGGEKPFESLANAPKQIFGALEYKRQKEIEDQERQLKHEQELKDYQLKQDTLRGQQDSDRERMRQREEDKAFEKKKYEDELARYDSPEQKEMRRLELETQRATLALRRTQAAEVAQRMKNKTGDEKEEIVNGLNIKRAFAKSDLMTEVKSNLKRILGDELYLEFSTIVKDTGIDDKDLPRALNSFFSGLDPETIKTLPKNAVDYIEKIEKKVKEHNDIDYKLNVAINNGKAVKEGIRPEDNYGWFANKVRTIQNKRDAAQEKKSQSKKPNKKLEEFNRKLRKTVAPSTVITGQFGNIAKSLAELEKNKNRRFFEQFEEE